MAFKVDPTRFQAEAALVRWQLLANQLGFPVIPTVSQKQLPTVLQLRWTLHNDLGLPTEPFIVWRRNKKRREPKKIDAAISTLFLFGNAQLVDLKGSYVSVDVTYSSPVAGAILAFTGAPLFGNIVTFGAAAVGNNLQIRLQAPAIEGLLVPNATTIHQISGVRADDLSEAAGWEKYERVGLPVRKEEWAGQGIGQHGTEQGFFTALVSANDAALDRLRRGAPPIGWAPLMDVGVPAPLWEPPAPQLLIDDLNESLLEDLRQVAALPPFQQAAKTILKLIPAPENSSGVQMNEPGTTSNVSPLKMTYVAANTDPFNALALGFGTAYAVILDATGASGDNPLDYDYMVTGRYAKGITGSANAVDYAAIVPAPLASLPPPVPASLAQEMMGHIRPKARDAAWEGSVRVSWDKPIPIPLFRARSFAFARSGVNPPQTATLIMSKRNSGGHAPIAVNYFTAPEDPEPGRTSAVDREIPIPNNPGNRTLKYAVAHQDIFGQWSKWSAINSVIQQPGVDDVRIVSAEFKYTNIVKPPLTKCQAKLVLEFLWDWRVRSPKTISFRGRLHPAAYPGEPPPNVAVPSGMQTKLAMAEPFPNTFTLNFDVLAANGAPTSSWPGYNPLADCIALNPAGDQKVSFGAAQGQEARRYRVTITGFELDYAATGHIGLALWAMGVESLAPQHAGAWSAEPSKIAASDPRPPLIIPEIVPLASLPDSAGECHAVLKWGASPGAQGYFIYESTEAKLRKAAGDQEPDPSQTLSQRVTRLLQIFDAAPLVRRSEFTRRNARLINGTSADVTLPRGSTSIHVYVVLGVSAGNVEAEWPASSAALFKFAAPRMPKPGVPMIEVTPFLDKSVNPNVFRARIRVETRQGPRVRRIDVHRVRVDDAARNLDTMGPPVLTVDPLTAGWQVTETNDALGSHITLATGQETPQGSWKRVWYRAAAWSDEDLLRGILPARSPSSSVAWVVIPPPGAPDLSPITMEWPGGDAGDVLLKWTSAAPLPRTPLGAHTIAIRAKRVGAPFEEIPLIAFDGDLLSLPTAQPPSGSGAWRVENTKPVQYRAIVRRADVNDAVDISVRLTDPVGRPSERLTQIEAGHILPDPVLGKFTLKPVVTPPGQLFGFASTSPLGLGYVLRATISRPPKPPLIPGGRPVRQAPIVLQMELEDIPLDEPGNIPPGSDPARLRRMPGDGPSHAYYLFLRVPFTQIHIRLTSPDGRFTEHTQVP